MELKNLTYLFLLFLYLVTTLIFYIWQKKHIGTKLKYALPSILITSSILILCEIQFSVSGIKNYNPDFILGIYIQKLALEGWIYYLIMSFGGILIFDFINFKLVNSGNSNVFLILSFLLLVIFALTAWFFKSKTYPFFIFFLSLVYFGYVIFRNRFKHLLSAFYITFAIFIIPCLLFDLLLAWLPAVSYDIQYLFGIQLIGVPIENFGMYFLLLIMSVTIYEFFSERKFF